MRANALVALLAGTLFGAGLAISGMTDPGKVIGFLDLAGQWDPSLAFVMGAAICISLPTFQLLRGRSKPVFASQYFLPTKQDLDPQLILGAVLFGIGWGIAGLCPGPAIANLAARVAQRPRFRPERGSELSNHEGVPPGVSVNYDFQTAI